jgi:hypothetical protein
MSLFSSVQFSSVQFSSRLRMRCCLSQVMDAVDRKREAMVRFLMLRAEFSDEELMSVDVHHVPEPLRASIQRGIAEWRRREWSHDVRFFLLAWRRPVVMQGLSSF